MKPGVAAARLTTQAGRRKDSASVLRFANLKFIPEERKNMSKVGATSLVSAKAMRVCALACLLALAMGVTAAAQKAGSVAGKWEMTSEDRKSVV